MGGFSRFLVTAIIVSFGTSFQSGYFLSLYNVPQDIVEQFINTSVSQEWNRTLSQIQLSTVWATISTTIQIGRLIGPFFASFFIDRIGRKWSMIGSSVVCIFGMSLLYLAEPTGDFTLLACGRLIMGIYNGIITIVAQVFLIEIAIAPNRRGSITRLHNVFNLLGTIVGFFVGLPELLGNENRWNYLPLVTLPQLMFSCLWLLMVPETPMYMVQRGMKDSVIRKSLEYYLGDSANNLIIEKKENEKPRHWWAMTNDCWKDLGQRQLIILWVILGLASACNGKGIVYNYLTFMISRNSTFTIFDRYASVIMTATSIFLFFPAIYIINKAGRRPLLLGNFWITALCILMLGILAFVYDSLNPIVSRCIHVILLFLWSSLQYITNSVSMLIVSESASQDMRALSLGIHATAYSITMILITLVFPVIFDLSEGCSYLLLGIPSIFIGLYLQIKCPETKAILFLKEDRSEKTPLLERKM